MSLQIDTYFRKLDTQGYILAPSKKSPLVTTPTVQVKKTIWVCHISKTVDFRASLMKFKNVPRQILGGKVVLDVKIGQLCRKIAIFLRFLRPNMEF